jgi:hypothetical protein
MDQVHFSVSGSHAQMAQVLVFVSRGCHLFGEVPDRIIGCGPLMQVVLFCGAGFPWKSTALKALKGAVLYEVMRMFRVFRSL